MTHPDDMSIDELRDEIAYYKKLLAFAQNDDDDSKEDLTIHLHDLQEQLWSRKGDR